MLESLARASKRWMLLALFSGSSSFRTKHVTYLETKPSCFTSSLTLYTLSTTENPFLRLVSPPTVNVVEESSVTLEFKIAADSDGNAWNTEEIYFTFRPFLDDNEGFEIPFSVCSTEFPQNYCYTIDNVDRSHEGVYVAFAISKFICVP